MTHAGVYSDRRLPRLPRYAGRSGTLDVGQIFRLHFWLGKKGGRLPGRDPANCSMQSSQRQLEKHPASSRDGP